MISLFSKARYRWSPIVVTPDIESFLTLFDHIMLIQYNMYVAVVELDYIQNNGVDVV
jgi:hypothetical protein